MENIKCLTKDKVKKFNEWKERNLEIIEKFQAAVNSKMPYFEDPKLIKELSDIEKEVNKFSVAIGEATYGNEIIHEETRLKFCLERYVDKLEKSVRESRLSACSQAVFIINLDILTTMFRI